jgi:hypothetical protein
VALRARADTAATGGGGEAKRRVGHLLTVSFFGGMAQRTRFAATLTTGNDGGERCKRATAWRAMAEALNGTKRKAKCACDAGTQQPLQPLTTVVVPVRRTNVVTLACQPSAYSLRNSRAK